MYAKYLGRDLYDKLESLVERAFYKIYDHSEANSCSIIDIEIDYSTCETDLDLPFIKLTAGYSTSDGDFSLTLEYSLEESDDFNVGRFYERFDNEFWHD